MVYTFNGHTYEVRGGAWHDTMNCCFWNPVKKLADGYVLCQETGTNELFVMYLPYYEEKEKR